MAKSCFYVERKELVWGVSTVGGRRLAFAITVGSWVGWSFFPLESLVLISGIRTFQLGSRMVPLKLAVPLRLRKAVGLCSLWIRSSPGGLAATGCLTWDLEPQVQGGVTTAGPRALILGLRGLSFPAPFSSSCCSLLVQVSYIVLERPRTM